MANHRDLQQLTRLHAATVHQDIRPCLERTAVQHFYNTHPEPRARQLNNHLHKTKNKVCKPRTTRSVRAKHTTRTTRPLHTKQKGSAGPMQTWLQNAASKGTKDMQSEERNKMQNHHCDWGEPETTANTKSDARKGTIMAYFHSKPSKSTGCLDEIRLPHKTNQHPASQTERLNDEVLATATEQDKFQGPKTHQIVDPLNNTNEAMKKTGAKREATNKHRRRASTLPCIKEL